MVPVNALPARESTFRDCSRDKSEGMDPENESEDSTRLVSSDSAPRDVGKVPPKELPARFKLTSDVISPI